MRLRQGRLLLEEEGREVAGFPARQVRSVALWGNVRLSTPALVFLLRQGVPVFFYSLEGFLHGVAGAYPDPHPAHLRAQFAAEGLPLARAFVVGKLRSALALLERHRLPEAGGVVEALARAEGASELERLRGRKGRGAGSTSRALPGSSAPTASGAAPAGPQGTR